MKSDQMWQAYKILNQSIGDKIDAWAFGVEADYLAELVLAIDIPVTVGRVSWLCRYPPHLSGRSSVSFFSDLGVR